MPKSKSLKSKPAEHKELIKKAAAHPALKKPAKIRPSKDKPIIGEAAPDAGAAAAENEVKDPGDEKYWEAVGRRKTAVARVRIYTRGDKGFWVNAKPLAEYFAYPYLQRIAAEAVETMKSTDRFKVTAKVNGGGSNAQAEAIRHGSARALVLFNPDFRKRLKRAGFLTRDPRMKERKKFGLKKARRAPQWQKR